jgi:hypothetical protein
LCTSIAAFCRAAHADLIPTFKDTGIAKEGVCRAKRGTSGNLRFEALSQARRTNHMSVAGQLVDIGDER